MKASKYNVFFVFEGYHVSYNTYSNNFIILDEVLYEMYNASVKKNDFSELEDIHFDFYNFLIQQGFIVRSDVDEFDLVKQQSITIDNDDSNFHLIVNPTMNCNFKCWYCYETHIKDSKMDADTIQSVIKFAKNIIEKQTSLKQFTLSFFGGEPLLYFDKVINPILTEIYTTCKEKEITFSSGMTTNGLLINQTMLDICKNYGLNHFQITLDGKKEQHDKVRFISEGKGSYNKIVDNIILIAKNKLRVNVRINCSATTMDGIDEILNDFDILSQEEKYYINFDMQKVWQEEEKIETTISSSRFSFRDRGYYVSGESIGSIKNSCYGDKRYQATVNYNGEVFKCTARDFKNETGEGILNDSGEIIWNDRFEKRLHSKFKNAPCKECRILPLCGGGCTQQAIENEGRDYCVMQFDEEAKTQIVVDKFKELLLQ